MQLVREQFLPDERQAVGTRLADDEAARVAGLDRYRAQAQGPVQVWNQQRRGG